MFDAVALDQDVAGLALQGLTVTPKTLPPKLFYDAEGVRLFGEITQLPEYYLTRTERALLTSIAPELAALAPHGAALVEYGASDEAKARLLLDEPIAAFSAYVPIDVAAAALDEIAARLHQTNPHLHVHPICADFTRPLSLPEILRDTPKFGFFPGSTIGNLEPPAAQQFLAGARATLGQGATLVVGFDLRKDPARLLPAYNDAAGVTAAFNLNLLTRLNREAGANFDLARFTHRAIWNDAESRIEMHLVSAGAQAVRVAGQTVDFAAGETIHTENSYKHSQEAFRTLAEAAGWTTIATWTDPQQLFAVHALRA
jgi:L-histidine Nalpha-methyltransferase